MQIPMDSAGILEFRSIPADSVRTPGFQRNLWRDKKHWLTTTTHTYLQGHPWTQLIVYLFIITMCDYMVQIMGLGGE